MLKNTVIAISFLIIVASCSPADGNKTGHEFMPDMVHSTAYEANYSNYYYYNTWGTEEDYASIVQPRKPVQGTIARGEAMPDVDNGIRIPANGRVPYYYDDTEEERTRAMEEIIDNPFPITKAGLDEGEELYTIYCAICHGDKGDGAGYIVRDDGGVYPNQPAILTSDEFIQASNGRFYHAIVYGKNVMGAHADKLSYEERWQVIHYIRSLQAQKIKAEYSEEANTLNDIDIPGVVYAEMHKDDDKAHSEEMDGEHSGDEAGMHHGDTEDNSH